MFDYDVLEETMDFPKKNHTRAIRRKRAKKKANRLLRIEHQYGFSFYDDKKGYLRKGKIHCSCPLCRAKTNARKMVATGNSKHRYDNYFKPSDRRKVDSCMDALYTFA